MRIHVECHAYEPLPVDTEWYESSSGEPAFSRAEALAYAARKEGGAT
jgi:hypothetical protein